MNLKRLAAQVEAKMKDNLLKDFKSVPRAKVSELPSDCCGCGRCCGPQLMFPISEEEAVDWLNEEAGFAEKLRGLNVKKLGGKWWKLTPSCVHLDCNGMCEWQMCKPNLCVSFQRGCDMCLLMYRLNDNKSVKTTNIERCQTNV